MKSHGDTLYKQLFAHPEIVRDLLAGFLAGGWAKALEVDAFERVNASYASDHGKTRHDDVVWRARIGWDWVYVYILLEFQTRPDRWMALRLMTTLQEEFSETSINLEEETTMLFDKKFKRYEDLLEYEAIEKGRAKGREEGRQEGQRIALRQLLHELLDDDSVSVEVSEKISSADSEQLQAWIKLLAKGLPARQLFAGS